MATITELKEHLENGGKIRRPCWGKKAYIYIDDDEFTEVGGLFYSNKELLLDDWEVYGEPKNKFEITHTGLYKTRDGRKVYICYINPSSPVVSGVYEGSEVLLGWNIDGSFDDGKKVYDIVAEWES